VTDTRRLRWWRVAALGLLLAWFGAVQVLNGPGHLSYDSLIQIIEGNSGVVNSFNPVFISVVFGKLAALGGPRLLVVCSSLMLLAGLLVLLPGVLRPRFAGIVLLAGALAGPILLIYPAIVWKDVWFAHFALLGFAVIALRHRLPGAIVETGSLLLFTAAVLSRPNGVIVAVCGAGTLGYARWLDHAPPAGMPRHPGSLLKGLGARLIVLAVFGLALSWVARLGVQQVNAGEVSTGVRLLLQYDIAGMIAREPAPDLSVLADQGADVDCLMATSRAAYRAERIDTLPIGGCPHVRALPDRTIAAQWFLLVGSDPAGYLGHRADVFSWLLGLHDQLRCLPVHVGFAEAALVEKAGVSAKPSQYSDELYRHALRFVHTPYFSPAAWAVGSAITLAFAMARRRRDPVMIGIQVAALAYLASYFFVSVACDFRYAYFSVVGATIGIVWLATGGYRRSDQVVS
jgi:hypothetical protein